MRTLEVVKVAAGEMWNIIDTTGKCSVVLFLLKNPRKYMKGLHQLSPGRR